MGHAMAANEKYTESTLVIEARMENRQQLRKLVFSPLCFYNTEKSDGQTPNPKDE